LVKLILLDYDGTISPIDVEEKMAFPSKDVLDAIKYAKRKVRVALVSTKACDVLIKKVDELDAYSCIGGAEVLFNDRSCIDVDLVEKQDNALEIINMIKNDYEVSKVKVEVKRTLSGLIAGFSIDWRFSKKPSSLEKILNKSMLSGMRVIVYENHPFVDILLSKKDKGDSVEFLRKIFNADKVVYFGDSENDLPAFLKSDISVLVLNGYNDHMKKFRVNEMVRFNDVGGLIRKYADN
jgi:hydroxymethylpyrimidine pyrophosphatase-like HAD family hydrolase